MNERIHKLLISAMAVCCSVLLLFPVTVRDVFADGDTVGNSNKENLTWILNNPFQYSKLGYSSSYPYVRIRYGIKNTNSLVTSENVYAINYKVKNSDGTLPENWTTLLFIYSDSTQTGGDDVNLIRFDRSSDKLNWTNFITITLSNIYTANLEGADTIVYGTFSYNTNANNAGRYLTNYMPNDCPRVILNYGQNASSILYLFSTDDFSYIPWNFSTSSGGMHFEDGSELSPSNTSTYSQVFYIMDSNHDNSVTEAEVYFYNSTYNTNYDYSEINESSEFNQMEFLNWIALQIANGNDNPGGGSGSGGGSDAINGGITVGDGSFTQSQTQTIEENAVNVTVNNDNSLNQENTQWLNSIINNNVGGEEQQNAFENAIGSISGFTGIARSFAGLAGAVLSFLPSWVTVLLGVMFALLFVLIVFRLIHLFI